MTRFLLPLTLAAGPALADPGALGPAAVHGCLDHVERPGAVSAYAGRDLIVLAPVGNAAAEVCYWNGPQVSRHGDYTLDLDGLTVRFAVDVGAEETLEIVPPPGFMVFPADDAEMAVQDGEAATALIVMGVS
jgi:hypothetical protein